MQDCQIEKAVRKARLLKIAEEKLMQAKMPSRMQEDLERRSKIAKAPLPPAHNFKPKINEMPDLEGKSLVLV